MHRQHGKIGSSDATFCRVPGSVLVVGIGNEFRSDDGLGLYVVRELSLRRASADHLLLRSLTLLELDGEGTALLNAWEGYHHVFIVDAVRSGKPPGTIVTLDAKAEKLPKRLLLSSGHEFGVAEAIEMARNLDCLPTTLKLFGIEGATFEPGVGLSEAVVRSVGELLHLLESEIRELTVKEAGVGAK
ncbi:MAG TPA: hydrogenase maturation protease [Bacteroidota bacterium]|nr:hydrogenase maturation protease [Bacteroidota bacterium]